MERSQRDFISGRDTRMCFSLATLPFLPEEQVIPVFNALKEQATSHMQPLIQYAENTWILSTMFKPGAFLMLVDRPIVQLHILKF